MNTLGTAGNVTNMNTVAGSIADVNRYANEYKIAATAPSSPSEGDLWYDSTSNTLKYYTGSAWAASTGSNHVEKTSATGSAILPASTTANRDGSPTAGYFRWNTTTTSAEIYDGSAWVAVGGGNTTTEGLWEHAHTISASYSIATTANAVSAGSITINSGVTVTVPATSTWVIV
jgi:hypothetical protein